MELAKAIFEAESTSQGYRSSNHHFDFAVGYQAVGILEAKQSGLTKRRCQHVRAWAVGG